MINKNIRNEIKIAIEYIGNNFHKKLTIDVVAKIAAMSSSHFKRIFKKQIGKTMSEYIIDLRTDQAIKLLQESNETLTSIALQCGFSTTSHFCYTLKKKYKKTSKQFIYGNSSENDLITI